MKSSTRVMNFELCMVGVMIIIFFVLMVLFAPRLEPEPPTVDNPIEEVVVANSEEWEEPIMVDRMLPVPYSFGFVDPETGELYGVIEIGLKLKETGYWIDFTWNGTQIMSRKTTKE